MDQTEFLRKSELFVSGILIAVMLPASSEAM